MSYAIPMGKEYFIYDDMGNFIKKVRRKPLFINILQYNRNTGLYIHSITKRRYIFFLFLLICFLPLSPLVFFIFTFIMLYYDRHDDATLSFIFTLISCFLLMFTLLTIFIIFAFFHF